MKLNCNEEREKAFGKIGLNGAIGLSRNTAFDKLNNESVKNLHDDLLMKDDDLGSIRKSINADTFNCRLAGFYKRSNSKA
jgi:hypothetical protein